jgi:hypothetical protein
MAFLNKKAVEALPLRYIIIALVAALVVGIALQMTGTLRGGIQGTAEKLNASVTEKVACELDEENPVIEDITVDNGTTEELTVTVDLTDDCGIDVVLAYLDKYSGSGSDETLELTMTSGTETDGTWSGTQTGLTTGAVYNVTIWTQDKATTPNEATELDGRWTID